MEKEHTITWEGSDHSTFDVWKKGDAMPVCMCSKAKDAEKIAHLLNQKKKNEKGSWYASDYKAKCAIAEKLGDVVLRQWCIERIGVIFTIIDYNAVEVLFKYIKEGEVSDV